jgi:hypothetical protein
MLRSFLLLLLVSAAIVVSEGNVIESAAQTVTADSINGVLYVRSGGTYPPTPSGIQRAIDQANSNGGGKVVLPPTNGSSIAMGTTGLTIYSNVCLVGAGMNATVLRWTGNVNAIAGGNGLQHACVKDLGLSFSAAAAGSTGIRIIGSDGITNVSRLDDFENIFMLYTAAAHTTGAGIYAASSGQSADIVQNTFRNIIVWWANQFAQCTGCEGNSWIDVQGLDIGQNVGAVMFQENGFNGDEIVIARMESGSASYTNEICYSTSGNNNLVKLTCDANLTGVTAIYDTGGYNIFDVDSVGTPILGTVAAKSQYRYVASASGTSTHSP